jgi:isoaspartyl peptidase/L-asparaginase-like protein (Ntn-hydrolase superfamily)
MDHMAAVIVHGGAYTIPDGIVESSLRGCQLAAKQAHKALEDGKSALDAGTSLLTQ